MRALIDSVNSDINIGLFAFDKNFQIFYGFSKLKFRKDINGLRAIAIIAVVLSHFNASWVPGGFAGVDVFFVISGYLMTAIILKRVEVSNFNLLSFYIARANRIVPTLAVLCFAMVLFGWVYLTPPDYQKMGLHAASSVSFISNLVYWQEAGYFDEASHEKWLLHTWSLAVECQFYILYPLLLLLIRRFATYAQLKRWVLFSVIAGFFVCVITTSQAKDAAYFLLPTRVWEMLFGGVAYLYPLTLSRKIKFAFEWFGIALIALTYFGISEATAWPGMAALIPVSGTFLVIQAHRDSSFITGNFVFQKLGRWSYSIYLWHWPLVVATHYFLLSKDWLPFTIALSIAMGYLSYRYIEPIKFASNNIASLKSWLMSVPVVGAIAVFLLGIGIYLNQGVKSRLTLPPELAAIDQELVMPLRSNGYCFYSFSDGQRLTDTKQGTNCFLGARQTQAKTLLFGDSFAGDNEPFWDDIFKEKGQTLKSITTNWCFPSLNKDLPVPNTHKAYEQCLLNRRYLKTNMFKYKNLIFAGSWGDVYKHRLLQDVEETLRVAADLGINVVIMAAPTRYKKNPLQGFYRSAYFGVPFKMGRLVKADILTRAANQHLERIANKYDNVHFLKRSMLFSSTDTLVLNGIEIPYSLDGVHISMLGAKHSAIHFRDSKQYEAIMSTLNL